MPFNKIKFLKYLVLREGWHNHVYLDSASSRNHTVGVEFLTIIFIIISSTSCSSNSTKNIILTPNNSVANVRISQNIDTGFTYKGKPISPGALLAFFVGKNDSEYANKVNLDTCKTSNDIHIDTTRDSGEVEIDYATEITPYYPGGTILYSVLGKVSLNTFVIDAGCCLGGNAVMSSTMVIRIRNNIIQLLGSFKANYNFPFKIKSNEIINGPKHYKIPNLK